MKKIKDTLTKIKDRYNDNNSSKDIKNSKPKLRKSSLSDEIIARRISLVRR